jgi:hypothetical protein
MMRLPLALLIFLPVSTSFTASIGAKNSRSANTCSDASLPCSDRGKNDLVQRTSQLPMSPRGNLEDEIEYNARRKAEGGGAGELAAGAILGGLLLGPFGALFGAQLGAQFGAKNAADRARQAEMERLGITQEMLDAAKEIGFTLEQSIEGLQASSNSLETQQRFAKRLEQNMEEIYDKAKREIQAGNEEDARKYLLERQRLQDKLMATLKACADERNRYKQMERNVAALEERAMEIESLLRRTVGAKTMQNSSMQQLSLNDEDPLLQKFRDMGIE